MGQLAAEIKQATTATAPAITDEILKVAVEEAITPPGLSEGEVGEKLKTWGKNIPGLPLDTQTLLNTLLWSGLIALPTAGLVAWLKHRAFKKAEKRRKEMMEDYSELSLPSHKIKLLPSTITAPVAKTAAFDKQAAYGIPTAIALLLLGPLLYNRLSSLGSGGLGDLFRTTGSPLSSKYGLPVIGASVPLAALAASSLMESKHNKFREARVKREREEAEQEFQRALQLEQATSKVASDNLSCFARGLDALSEFMLVNDYPFEQLNKQAKFGPEPSPAKGWGNFAISLYIAALLTVMGGAGTLGWQYAKSKDKSAKRNKALKQLLARRALATPPVMSATTKPALEDEEFKTIAEEPI